jgi:monoamine oxidase
MQLLFLKPDYIHPAMSANELVIGIAGAGVASLTTGIVLQRAGHQVQIFESRPVPGGRIRSLVVQDHLIEGGPEFIHGKGKETIRLLNKYRIPFVPANGKMYQAQDGRFSISDEMGNADWGKLLVKMKSLDHDMPFGEFLNRYFSGTKYDELRNSATGFAEGFDLADIEMASTTSLALEWMQEESGQFRIPAGYHTLILAMADEFRKLGGSILYDHAIESVNWRTTDIGLTVRGNRHFKLEKLVVTLPVSLLSPSFHGKGQPVFSPPITEKLNAFGRIGYGTVIKIVMVWKSAFWKHRIPDAQFIFSETVISTWWTQFPLDLPLLTGWMGGPAADEISDKPDDFFLEKALESLSVIFSISQVELKDRLKLFHIFNWKKDMWAGGGYSYSLVDSAENKVTGRKPLENRIYFAGEALYDGPFQGTVEAAIVSGQTAATQLLADIK